MYLTLDVLVLVLWSQASNIGLGIRMGRQLAARAIGRPYFCLVVDPILSY